MIYRSEIAGVVHEMANDMYEIGIIDKKTMREFDKGCLTKIEPLSGDEIRAIREEEALSQAAFALYLNISKNHVSDLERGVKKPSGALLKLLMLVKNKGISAIV